MKIRYANERGSSNLNWLSSQHSFSFAGYYDPAHMGFATLRVINEDTVAPGEGFGKHPHNNMEIVSYVLEGALEHQDSMGNRSVIHAGEVQRMSAGSGVVHSEYNHSKTMPVHFLQIWILPEKENITPNYEQKDFSTMNKNGKFAHVLSPEGKAGALHINQDVNMYIAELNSTKQNIVYPVEAGRNVWVQIARGKLKLNDQPLQAGDGVAIARPETLNFTDGEAAEIILFDMLEGS